MGCGISLPNAEEFADDSWVEVEGTIARQQWEGEDIIVVQATSGTVIPQPSSPYVYPNNNFLEADLAPEED
ncbi:MAG: hypothetical protein QJR00_08125 [Bacillota bacterium]|nr:hypothetical protein [Bacillota bacterium]